MICTDRLARSLGGRVGLRDFPDGFRSAIVRARGSSNVGLVCPVYPQINTPSSSSRLTLTSVRRVSRPPKVATATFSSTPALLQYVNRLSELQKLSGGTEVFRAMYFYHYYVYIYVNTPRPVHHILNGVP